MRHHVVAFAVVLLACSTDGPPVTPGASATGAAGQAGAPTADTGGSSSGAAGETSAGQAGAMRGRHSGGKLPQATLTCDFGSTVVRIANKTAICRDLTVTLVD